MYDHGAGLRQCQSKYRPTTKLPPMQVAVDEGGTSRRRAPATHWASRGWGPESVCLQTLPAGAAPDRYLPEKQRIAHQSQSTLAFAERKGQLPRQRKPHYERMGSGIELRGSSPATLEAIRNAYKLRLPSQRPIEYGIEAAVGPEDRIG